jgi:hypothetical protein
MTTNKRRAAKVQKPQDDRLSAIQQRFLSLETKNPVYREMMAFSPDMYTEVIRRIPDDDLQTLIAVPNLDPFALFHNLDEVKPAPSDEQHAQRFSALARAVRSEAKQWEGRLVSAWFVDWFALPRSTRWQRLRLQSLLDAKKNPVFNEQWQQIVAGWPENLYEFRNTSLPARFPYLVNPQESILRTQSETRGIRDVMGPKEEPERKYPKLCRPYPPEFITAAHAFVRDWNIERISLRGGKHMLVLPRPQCASDVDGQGTWVFIPRHYSFTSMHKGAKEDFAALAQSLSRNYEIFETGKRTREELLEECVRDVRERLAGRPPTPEEVTTLAMEWCRQGVKSKGSMQRRISDDKSVRYYVRGAIKALIG